MQAMRSYAAATWIGLALATALAGDGGWQATFDEDETSFAATGRNAYFVLEPGYTLELEGRDDGLPLRLVITVLDETRTVDGVETRVVEERESVDGRLVEISRNYFAISSETSNVYYFGEETTLIADDGTRRQGEDSWEAGVDGATYGMIMPGSPQAGMKHYQEHAPATAMDRAEVVGLDERVTVPAGEFTSCLRVRETNPLEHGEEEYKLYAPGVGLLVDENLKLVRYGPGKVTEY